MDNKQLETTATLSWVADTNLPSTFTIPVTVNSEDGGSFGTLVATFNSNTCSINIPKDDNGDYIGDSWETSAWKDGRHTPPADEETGPNAGTGVEANTQVGDGLVIFEEYRGFEISDHIRGSVQHRKTSLLL